MIEMTVSGNQTFSLPEEIFINAISFLAPKNIARLLTVSTKWYQHLSSNDLWITLCPKISVKKASERFFLSRYPDLTGINLAARIGKLRILKTLCGHTDRIACMKVTEKTIISGSYDKRIHTWDPATCLQAKDDFLNFCDFGKENLGHKKGVIGLDILGDNFVVAGFCAKKIIIKDLSEKTIQTLVGHKKEVKCFEVCDNMIFSGSRDKTIRIWDEKGSLQKTLRGHTDAVTCLQVIEKTIISGSDDKTICIWDQALDLPLQTLSGHESLITCLKATDTFIVSGSYDKTIRIWDRSNYTLRHTLEGHTLQITSLEIVDTIIVSGSADQTVRFWNIFTGALLHTQEIDTHCIKFFDNTLLIGTVDGDIQIWG